MSKQIDPREKTRELIINMPSEEISYLFGRYCGPGNELLSLKKFGFVLNAKVIEDEVFARQFEDHLTAEFEKSLSETPDKIEE